MVCVLIPFMVKRPQPDKLNRFIPDNKFCIDNNVVPNRNAIFTLKRKIKERLVPRLCWFPYENAITRESKYIIRSV